MAQVTGADSVDSTTRASRDPAPRAWLQAGPGPSRRRPNRSGSASSVSGTSQPRRSGWYSFCRWYPAKVRRLVPPTSMLSGRAP